MAEGGSESVVEVRPEVVFLYELLAEIQQGRLRIPRFQRAFVWRLDQMTDLLDSVNKQYPIGSLLVWETTYPVATLERLGPFKFPEASSGPVGYLLDGHQRLSTLAGALIPRDTAAASAADDAGTWNIGWNLRSKRFQHYSASSAQDPMFPLTSLLDTLHFLRSLDVLRSQVGENTELQNQHVATISELARAFQSYRVPVIRIRQTGLSEAVEIFARLNSKGQAMSADQMVSALMFRQDPEGRGFDLASEIDTLVEMLAEENFGDIDRTTVLRAILANIDEDIYKTDWTRLASSRRDDLLARLDGAVGRTRASLERAVAFLEGIGVSTSRLLPYGMQLVVLSAFFDRVQSPTVSQERFLRRWFWVSSFSAWFGGANPSRVSGLIREFRTDVAEDPHPVHLTNFDMGAQSLPYPTTFDMRSARTRALLLVMLLNNPLSYSGDVRQHAWHEIATKGPNAVGQVFWQVPRRDVGNPANRIIRPPDAKRGSLRPWLEQVIRDAREDILRSHAVNEVAVSALMDGAVHQFIRARQDALIAMEHSFQIEVGVTPSSGAAMAPIDTE